MFVKLIYSTRGFIYFITFTSIFSSCATIFSGTTQNVRVRSKPGSAKVYVNGKDTGIFTNGKIKINRAVPQTAHNSTNEQHYLFKKEGYQDLYIRDRRTINGLALAFDLFFPPAVIIDFLNGSIYKYRKKLSVQLIRETLENQEKPISIADKTEEIAIEPVIEEPIPEINETEEVTYSTEESIDENIPVTSKVNTNAIAVLIANENYVNPDITNVEYATEDVATMKNYLTKSFGFREGNIIVINNASLADFNRIFGNKLNHKARLYNLVKPLESDVFVFYSGHGAPSLENKEGYIVPVECQDISLLQFEGYSLNTLFDNLAEIPYKSLTVILDACFSGNTHSGTLIKNASPIYIAPRLKLLNKENTVLFASSKGDQISSWYPEKAHSLFTYYLLKGIKEQLNSGNSYERSVNNKIGITELATYLNEHVPYQARVLYNRTQTPEVLGDTNGYLMKY